MIAFLGAGNIGTALALILGKRARHIALYAIDQAVIDSINQHHQNAKYLPGHHLPAGVFATNDIREALHGARFVFITLPSQAVTEVLSLAKPHLRPDAIIVSVTKGIDPETFHPLILRQMELMNRAIQNQLVVLGGPAIANELALGQATGLVAASQNVAAAKAVRQALSQSHIHISLSHDVVGVGLTSSLKNAYAIGLGMCDGLQVSTNTKGLIFTTALEEMVELVTAIGGQKETVYGIAGVGDLFVSGNSFHARNRSYGQRLVTSETKDPQELGFKTVEGIVTVKTALSLAKRYKVKAPLLQAIHESLERSRRFSLPFEKYLRGRG